MKLVHRIFDMALQDIGCKEIAKTLNREGIRTGNGQRWGKTTVHKILTNEAYCGTLVWGGRPGHPAIHSGIPPVRIENAWPAIIDKEIFAQIQQKMSSKRPTTIHPRTVPSFYLLSGILFCSCGHAMIGRSAKSHKYYYYTCNGSYKKGKDTCDARALSKDKLEKLVTQQLKAKVLNQEWLKELVGLVNEELDSSHDILREKMDDIDARLNDVRIRLFKLYDALETNKLSLDDLAPRIKELRAQQDDLSKTRLQLEAEKITQGVKHIDAALVKSYVNDMKDLLGGAAIVESKAFIRSFVKRIEIDGERVKINYVLPMPPDGKLQESFGVLPMVTLGGLWETVPELLFEKKGLIPALQQILVSFHTFR
ncbi:recombinase family protein [Chloroflexota bacterium]